jgi:phosphoesterase RecJ-like protein
LPKSNLFTKDLPTKGEWILITVDSGDIKRLGDRVENYRFKEIWNIDHHASNTRFGKHNFIDIKAGSTGQVVTELLESLPKFKLDKAIANAVFCTLSTDTGSFRYSNATPEVFGLAKKLVEHGARPELISEALYETYPARRLALMKLALQSLKFTHDGKLARLYQSLEDMATVGAKPEDSEEFVNLPRGVVGVKVVCFLKQKAENQWKLSLRSRGKVNVLSVAQAFGGSGHVLTAGATVDGNLKEINAKLEAVLEKQGVLK